MRNKIKDLYDELSQLRELEQQIREFQLKHKNSPCIFSEYMQEQLTNRINELKTKIADFHD